MRTSVRVVLDLLKRAREVEFRKAWPHAQTAFMVARTMGGYDGTVEEFIPPWARVDAAPRKALVSTAVDASIRTALRLGLVSQDALDALVLAGFDA